MHSCDLSLYCSPRWRTSSPRSISRWLFLSFSRSFSKSLAAFNISSFAPYLSPAPFSLSVSVSVSVSVAVAVSPSLSIYLSIYLSCYLSIYLSLRSISLSLIALGRCLHMAAYCTLLHLIAPYCAILRFIISSRREGSHILYYTLIYVVRIVHV